MPTRAWVLAYQHHFAKVKKGDFVIEAVVQVMMLS